MKKAIIVSIIGLTASLWACSGAQESNDSSDNSISTTSANNETATTESGSSALEQTLTQTTASIPTNTNSNTQVMLNPEHGKPGHRCEIPVGAPLNSPPQGVEMSPAPTAQPVVQTQQAPAQPIQDIGPVNPALRNSIQGLNNTGKINPPHGQPGHDCAVPVGAPLPAK